MSAFRQVVRRLGKSGLSFLVVLALYLAFYFTGRVVQAFFTLFVLVPLGAFVTFRALRFIQRHSLWSVRNRLLFVYGLIGVFLSSFCWFWSASAFGVLPTILRFISPPPLSNANSIH